MVFPFYGHTAHLSYDGDFKLGALILKSWRISLWQSWLTPRRMINRCNANWTCCIICRHLDLPTPWSTHDVGLLNYAEHREVLKSPPQVQFLGCSIKKCTVLYIASIPFSHQHRFMSSINITLHHTHTCEMWFQFKSSRPRSRNLLFQASIFPLRTALVNAGQTWSFPPSLRSVKSLGLCDSEYLKFDHRNSPDIRCSATFEWAIVSSDGQFWYLMVKWILKLFTPRIGWSADTTNPLWWRTAQSICRWFTTRLDVMGKVDVL